MKKRKTSTYCDPATLTSALNYVWVHPPKPTPAQGKPFWTQPDDDTVEELIANLIGYEWKVAYIRQQINRLKIKPRGRTRAALMRQLIEGFLDPNRFTRQLNTLNDEEQRFYTYLLLYTNLTGLRTSPISLDQFVPLSKTSATLTQRIIDVGLGLRGEDGEFFVPFKTFSMLPPRYISFPTEPEPSKFERAADPQLLLTQIQQLLSLIQTQTYKLRPRPRWNTPQYGYGSNYQVWPPAPDDAKRIRSDNRFHGRIDLCAPAPHLDDDALAAWSSTLGLPSDAVEFVYNLMVASDIVLPGSPVTVDESLIQTWMMQTPGSQIVLLHQLYRNLANWGEWWPRWRDGRITVGWNYQNYWLINGIDRSIGATHYMLRWVILDLLSYLPHDAWLSVDKVAKLLGTLYPNPRTHHYAQQDLLLKGGRGWKGFLREVLLSVIQGPLYYLGFADVAPDHSETVLFRLHRFQDVHWGRVNDIPTGEAQLLGRDDVRFLERDHILQVTPPAPAEFLIAVQQWAQPKGLSNNKLIYQLDVQRLHSTFERGETPETLASAWESTTTFSPPAEISRWWQKWGDRYGHVRLYTHQATLMTRDDFTMHELQVALPTLRDSLLGLVTPRVALLQTEQVDKILSDLERQGYMPKEMS